MGLHEQLPNTLALEAYAVASLTLVGLFYFLAFRTGGVRTQARAVVNPEDVRVYPGASVVDVERPEVQRVKRAHLNLLENSVPFFVVGFLFALTRPGLLTASTLYGVFVASRVVHAAVYLGGRQPVRSAAWFVGVAAVVVMAGFVVWSLGAMTLPG
ncbi:MAG TPA: MAPEG family protein [Polyangiaceae bacterium]|nr:MAPEG family protein [Polyangiaceae bacterium]